MAITLVISILKVFELQNHTYPCIGSDSWLCYQGRLRIFAFIVPHLIPISYCVFCVLVNLDSVCYNQQSIHYLYGLIFSFNSKGEDSF